VAIAYAALLALLHARPGLAGVVLWWVGPPLVGLAAAGVLVAALRDAWRGSRRPTLEQLVGYAVLVVIVAALVTFRTYPSSYDARPSDVSFRLPLDGPVTVAWGGRTLSVNYHAQIPDQRWAYDLVVTENGSSFRGDGTRPEDYLVYGRLVLAPADGLVVAVRDGEPDAEIGRRQLRRAAGNHVILRVAPREFLFIAHLQRGSSRVEPGQRVRAGDAIGKVGNSGNSSEPHVHVHLQDTPTHSFGEAIPMFFHGYRVDGRLIGRGMPSGGRHRRARFWNGAFTGQIVEQVRAP
jgi:hypothetical protein